MVRTFSPSVESWIPPSTTNEKLRNRQKRTLLPHDNLRSDKQNNNVMKQRSKTRTNKDVSRQSQTKILMLKKPRPEKKLHELDKKT
jgi:hypothetical protein